MSQALAVHHGAFGRVALYELDRPFATHAHREGHLVFHVDGSPGVFPAGGDDLCIAPGHGAALSPWEPHGFRPVISGAASICLVLYIRGDWFAGRRVPATPALSFGRREVEVTGSVALRAHRVTELLLAVQAPGAVPSDRLDGELFDLTSDCFERSWQAASPALRRSGARAPAVPSDFRVRRAIGLIRERLGAELVLDDVARDAGLSRAHFYKLFRSQTGITPNIFLNTLRMERAIEGLVGTERTVTEIGFELGFASQASFTRFFCANVGIAPSDYRRKAAGHTPDWAA